MMCLLVVSMLTTYGEAHGEWKFRSPCSLIEMRLGELALILRILIERISTVRSLVLSLMHLIRFLRSRVLAC